MKRSILTACLSALFLAGFAQQNGNPGIRNDAAANTNGSMMLTDQRASFPGGEEQMISYIKETVIDKIFETSSTPRSTVPPATILFSVNEEGRITDVKLSATSTDPKIDRLFLEAISNMPAWKPAENEKGRKVKQELEVSIPYTRSGC